MSAARRLAEAQVAVMLLTRLPAGRLHGRAPSLGEAAWAFPLAGALVGAVSWVGFALAAAAGLPPAICALLSVTVAVLATGGLHEDGLADLADGLGGGRDRAAKLAIMRDSRIGSYGVLALILALALKAASVTELAAPGLAAFVATGAAARGWVVLALAAMPAAREDGLGRAAGTALDQRTGAALALAALLLAPLGAAGLTLAVAGGLAAVVVAAVAWRQVGGQTGDVLGAVAVTAELAGWLALAAVAA